MCRALVERSAQVRAVVRRAGSAPGLDGVTELVGEFADEGLAREVTQGADAVVTTVHPMGAPRDGPSTCRPCATTPTPGATSTSSCDSARAGRRAVRVVATG
ncbi:hypothetical protein MY520_26155 [Geodermatophilus sp. CPCC 205506]